MLIIITLHFLLYTINYIIKNELKVEIIKDLYFSDSRESKTANTYLFYFPRCHDVSNRNNFTFYYVIQQNASTNYVMSILIHWNKYNPGIDGVYLHFNFYIHVSKSQIKILIKPLINQPHISLINISNNALIRKRIGFRYGQ